MNSKESVNTIKNRYGSKKGLLRSLIFESMRLLGFYRAHAQIKFDRVKRLVFVCQGNICRSPLAEAIARTHDIPTTSFGLDTRGGDAADPRAQAWAVSNGYDLCLHVTKRVDEYQPLEGDLLVGMEPKHVVHLNKLFAHAPVQITLAGLWLNSPKAYLHDPYNSNSSYFVACEANVEQATLTLLKQLG